MNRADFKDQTPMGVGSSRMTFAIPKQKRVVKFAKGGTAQARRKGIDQNSNEYDIYKHASGYVSCLCPVYSISQDYQELVMAKAIPITKFSLIPYEHRESVRDFRRKLKAVDMLLLRINERTNLTELKTRLSPEERKVMRSKLFKDIYTLIEHYDMAKGDLTSFSSWGLRGKRFVLIDYGLTMSVYRDHYDKRKKQMMYS